MSESKPLDPAKIRSKHHLDWTTEESQYMLAGFGPEDRQRLDRIIYILESVIEWTDYDELRDSGGDRYLTDKEINRLREIASWY